MKNIPSELKYTASHEWSRLEEDGLVTIGITDHAQSLLGDIVFIELPEVDADIEAGAEAGVVESVKAASDIYIPITGTVVTVNKNLLDKPEMVNSDPYGEGWLFQIQPLDEEDLNELMDADEYAEQVASEEH
jgi:glycine cleavage system H protein